MYNPFCLKGKNILVTGASSGIGEACALVLSKLGANLIITGRNKERLEQVYSNLEPQGTHVVSQFDMQNVEQIPSWIQGVLDERDITLDGFIYSTGIVKLSPIRTLTVSQINELMNVNLHAGIMLLKTCTNKKNSNDGSSFVFISSANASLGAPGNSIYSASKAAIDAMVRSSAVELSPRVRVNSIAPGLVETPLLNGTPNKDNIISQHPLGLGQPEDIAFASAYLLSNASRWVTGTTLAVDGGFSVSK